MKIKTSAIILIISAVLIVSGGYFLYNAPSPTHGTEITPQQPMGKLVYHKDQILGVILIIVGVILSVIDIAIWMSED